MFDLVTFIADILGLDLSQAAYVTGACSALFIRLVVAFLFSRVRGDHLSINPMVQTVLDRLVSADDWHILQGTPANKIVASNANGDHGCSLLQIYFCKRDTRYSPDRLVCISGAHAAGDFNRRERQVVRKAAKKVWQQLAAQYEAEQAWKSKQAIAELCARLEKKN